MSEGRVSGLAQRVAEGRHKLSAYPPLDPRVEPLRGPPKDDIVSEDKGSTGPQTVTPAKGEAREPGPMAKLGTG